MNETIHTPRSSKLEDAPYMLTNPHSRTRKANWQRVPPSDRWFSGSPCWSCVVFTWLSFPQRRRLDPMLRDHCLSLLTLNLSPPPTPPSSRACGTGVAASRMRASVKMRFWLQFLGLIICRRHLVLRVTSLAETANIYLLHTAECGGRAHGSKWRRRLKLSYRYKARFPTGSVQPRRGRGSSETLRTLVGL